MKIYTSKKFEKQYAKLHGTNQQQFKAKVEIFRQNPFDSRLRNHPIKGKKYRGYRSIDIAGDLRALYTEREGGEVVIFGFIGTHAQLYN